MTVKPTYVGKFVNVYLEDRAYGGPEEGGWWYDSGRPVRSTEATHADLAALLELDEAWCLVENDRRRSNTGSVLSEGKYLALVEDGPAAYYPAERPHYE